VTGENRRIDKRKRKRKKDEIDEKNGGNRRKQNMRG
jgi:hypothetical protein